MVIGKLCVRIIIQFFDLDITSGCINCLYNMFWTCDDMFEVLFMTIDFVNDWRLMKLNDVMRH